MKTLLKFEWMDIPIFILVITLCCVTHLSVLQTDFYQHPMVDAYVYLEQAKKLAMGSNPFEDGFYQSPIYPLFLWLCLILFDENVLWGALILQNILFITTGFVLYACGLKLHSRWTGRIAMLLFTSHPYLLLFSHDYLPVVLCLFFMSLFLYALLHKREYLAAMMGGMMVLSHPITLILSLLPCYRRQRYALVLALMFFPTSIYNIHKGDWALVSHNAGINFYMGNGADWERSHFTRPGIEFRNLILDAKPHSKSLSERNRYWIRRTFTEIHQNPIEWGDAIFTKTLWSLSADEIPRNEDYRCRLRHDQLRWLQAVPVRWFWLFPLGVIGGIVLLKERKSSLLAYWFVLQIPLVLFLVGDRYRIISLPVLALMSAYILSRAPNMRMLGFLPLFAIPWLVNSPPRDLDWCSHSSGNIHYMENRFDAAQKEYELTLRLRNENPDAKRYLAEIYAQKGDLDVAIEYLQEISENYPNFLPTRRRMAALYEKQQRWEKAIHERNEILRRAPTKRRDFRSLFTLLMRLNRKSEMDTLRALYPDL